MSRQQTLGHIRDCGIVAVIRGQEPEILVDVCSALAQGGVTGIEITFTVPQAHRVLELVAEKLGSGVQLGAGTVLDAETARIAILSGAQFVVAPIVDEASIELCHRYDVPVMPGALTPTEVVRAWQAGADVVKVFPSDLTGPAYLKALKGPLPQVELMPTGGVNLETAIDFLAAGAWALGVGGSLVEKKAVEQRDFVRIEQLASQFVKLVRQFRADGVQSGN